MRKTVRKRTGAILTALLLSLSPVPLLGSPLVLFTFTDRVQAAPAPPAAVVAPAPPAQGN
ncbi:MAG: hypothetical protein GVY16_10715 [Planctomycetes bacterium]|jgi:hypothetical protein|nr:hypothetical protein [Phycisphaerae bacterium]NBB96193.1 hypothetical protein [Planctomycetota bacterium]